MTDATLRAATADDAEAILVVHVAAIVAHGPAAYTDRQVAAWAAKTEGTDRYVAAVEDPTRELVVAEAEGRVVGFGELDVEGGEVEAIFVDPAFDGDGIGTTILERFEDRLRAAGVGVVRLRAVRNAVGFYRRSRPSASGLDPEGEGRYPR